MLYQFVDFQHFALQPLRLMAEATRSAWAVPMRTWNPWLPPGLIPGLVPGLDDIGRAIAAGAELVERCTRRFGKPEYTIPGLVERVVDDKPFCRLIHFVSETSANKPRVLLVAPMSGHHASLLRDTIAGLSRDHHVYVTDWIDARMVPQAEGRFGLDTYIDYVLDAIRRVGMGTHVVAVCQAAVPVLAAVALMATADDPHQPSSMVLMGGPIDPSANPTLPVQVAAGKPLSWFEHGVISTVPPYYPGGGRRVYPGFLQLTGFMSMHADRHIGEHIALFRHLVDGDGDSADAHRRFYDEYLSVMDLTAEFYLDTIRTVFLQQDLARGTMKVHGEAVDPAAIRQTALMTVEGARDDISGPGQTVAAHRLCASLTDSQRLHRLQDGVGHFGMFNGRRWREDILPAVTGFIASHQD